MDIIVSLVSGFLSLILATLAKSAGKSVDPWIEKLYYKNPNSNFSKFLSKIFVFTKEDAVPYSDRINTSLDKLKKASLEIDEIMREFSKISNERQSNIEELELKLESMVLEEENLKAKIQTLENIPIGAMQYFEDILKKGEKRSAYRDYILFCLGVIVSVIITIVIKALSH